MGATGGSGTRVVARIARRTGLFIGTRLNPGEDALDLAEYLDRWINPFLARGHEPELEAEMRADLAAVLEKHRPSADRRPWGWKEPRSIFLLPFFTRALPGLRFLHVVRDGRDMAFSKNQRQPRKHGVAFLGPAAEPDSPPRSIALWSELNLAAARVGEEELRERYLRIRFEDLCASPEPVIARVLDFLELEGDPAELAEEVVPPPTLGRWRQHDPPVVRELERVAMPALERFRYLD